MPKRVLYGVANYEELVAKNGYFVDKTAYIEKLEQIENPVFLRPRRFGKSLWCRLLECYYDIRQGEAFEQLFGHTYIGGNPTPLVNAFIVLHLDFSTVNPSGALDVIEKDFNATCNLGMETIVHFYRHLFDDDILIHPLDSAASNLKQVLKTIQKRQLPPLYVIIDEYDNFANQLIVSHQDAMYNDLMTAGGFLKTFFKTLKQGRKSGSIANVYITGVLPITIDDLASGFNIATFITLDPDFEQMLGFTQAEANALLNAVYHDYNIDPGTRDEVLDVIKSQYNGYHFAQSQNEGLYNSTILLYFLNWLVRFKTIPKHLTDMNLKTDLAWVRRLTASNPRFTEEFVNQLTLHNRIRYDEILLMEKFNIHQFFEKGFFPISFFYLGMLTKQDDFYLKLPNLNMRKIFTEYFNEIHHIDVSTQYTGMMQRFINDLNLPALFAGYWQRYVAQLPEAIFEQVNENFYRTTFYELCSRYLSRWFTWQVERSYAQGRTDLEFVGRFHEKFAGVRMVIEFKYYSNTQFQKLKTPIDQFEPRKNDARQLSRYAHAIRQAYPEAAVSQFLIYCFGNSGFRVFDNT